MVLTRHAYTVLEMSAAHAQLRCHLVHQADKGILRTGNVLGQCNGGVVARLDDHSHDQVFKTHTAIDLDEHARAFRTPGFFADVDHAVQLLAILRQFFKHQVGGHELGQAGGLDTQIRVAGCQYCAAVVIEQQPGFTRNIRCCCIRCRQLFLVQRIGRCCYRCKQH